MAAGSHFDFDNDHIESKINGNRTLNKMMLVWRKLVKQF
jgi:hypothetical protein